MLEVSNLKKVYKNSFSKEFIAVENINFTLENNQSLCIYGESGSGKSTIAQMIAGLIPPTTGEIKFNNEILGFPFDKKIRNKIQIVFQHPESSFNPKLKIVDSMKEPYELYHSNWDISNILESLENMGLKEEFLYRYPNQLSGGELQRLSILRALATDPELLILDEATSMLDVVTQAKIIHKLKNYQKSKHLSYLFISHNKALTEYFSEKIIVLK